MIESSLRKLINGDEEDLLWATAELCPGALVSGGETYEQIRLKAGLVGGKDLVDRWTVVG